MYTPCPGTSIFSTTFHHKPNSLVALSVLRTYDSLNTTYRTWTYTMAWASGPGPRSSAS